MTPSHVFPVSTNRAGGLTDPLGQKGPIDTVHPPRLRACALDVALERSRPYSRRALQRGAAGGTCTEPRGRAARYAEVAKGNPLAGRLADNEALLLHAYRTIAKAISEERAITPAAEWLVDNYHLMEKQIREIRSDLPPVITGNCPSSPRDRSRDIRGYLGVAWAFIAHTDSRFDPEMLVRYVRAYQEVQPLTIGELWAVAITLRIVLVENLRRLAELIVRSRISREEADDLADRLLGAGGHAAEPVPVVLAGHRRAQLPNAFAVQLVHRLRDQDLRIIPALTWLDDRLAAQGTTADAAVRDEHQRQGAATVTVRNIITSMRLISDVDWTELFERISLVDDVLVALAPFPTWISRRAISTAAPSRSWRGARITRKSTLRAAPSWPRSAAWRGAGVVQGRQGDPGYHLLAAGRAAFEVGDRLSASASYLAWTPEPGDRYWRLCQRRRIAAAVILASPLFALAAVGLHGAGSACSLAWARSPPSTRRSRW